MNKKTALLVILTAYALTAFPQATALSGIFAEVISPVGISKTIAPVNPKSKDTLTIVVRSATGIPQASHRQSKVHTGGGNPPAFVVTGAATTTYDVVISNPSIKELVQESDYSPADLIPPWLAGDSSQVQPEVINKTDSTQLSSIAVTVNFN